METRPTTRPASGRYQPTTRRGHRAEKPATLSPVKRGADGFLNHVFEPTAGATPLVHRHQREIDFCNSLDYLCQYYALDVPDYDNPYPYNVALALNEVRTQLCESLPGTEVEIVCTPTTAASLMVKETFNTDHTLWFIPVKPLAEARAANAPESDLLSSIYAFLSQQVGIDYFTNSGYVAYEYDRLKEYYEEEMCDEENDSDHLTQLIAHIEVAQSEGEPLYKHISRKKHLKYWQNRIRAFKPQTPAQTALLGIAKRLYGLYRHYPTAKLFDFLPQRAQDSGFQEDDDYDRMDAVTSDQYIAFVWTEDGVTSDIIESINCDIQNSSGIDEPESRVLFDRPNPAPSADMRFVNNLFDCINDFIYLYRPPDPDDENQDEDHNG